MYYVHKLPTLYFIQRGSGSIEVDFRHYANWDLKLIFIDRDQYIRFPNDTFEVIKVPLSDAGVAEDRSYRVLFKHIVNLGTIDYFKSVDWIDKSNQGLLDYSATQWVHQNPFKVTPDQKEILFDTKELIDRDPTGDTTKALADARITALFLQKVGVSIPELAQRRRILRCQRDLAFSEKSVKEIAYDHGFYDPSHFVHYFKRRVQVTPQSFRNSIEYPHPRQFMEDLQELIIKYHLVNRDPAFYAQKLKISSNSLHRKVKQSSDLSFFKLMKQELLLTAKSYLRQGMMIKEVASRLQFKEPNHFTAFFKNETGKTPSRFIELYNRQY